MTRRHSSIKKCGDRINPLQNGSNMRKSDYILYRQFLMYVFCILGQEDLFNLNQQLLKLIPRKEVIKERKGNNQTHNSICVHLSILISSTVRQHRTSLNYFSRYVHVNIVNSSR